ncbi:aldo/keto reductase [Elizabethkingia anophelis]|uniref:Aldo/keto reductase n=1 Tax=Elizabethkingia anophelis TaxID=1117645 RepID=A0AAU8VIY4_9FLAO|nr:aldo/keto reductase [Elizabethkingia anophelis]AQX02896.1 aldo/keto reductase [Elizabethkingia anophelis]MCW2463489.1 aryl-alcohol dehydrogenase-like predicted oxidoreductase [Elizabethkingia anophelis]MCW2467174.1 aryl-alcohol dehydrogenase-like predicted oxidoreductase [Elizabethkingia anophelis]MCW2470678.1 aryl-alcohol dehydrogenase-like predicted oxidoreductase [Elizabethkingia anophelis]MDV3506132.1 aldo/keto reductase [Elizabethkingia anophelis]
MEFRKLGNTDLELSAITYGAFAIGGNMWGGNEKKDSIASVRASIDSGVTTLDTAPFYGFGLSEEMIGEAIKGSDRSKIQLLTKFGLVWDGSNQGKGEFFFDAEEAGKTIPVYKYASKTSVIKEVEESLKRLQTDYIDLLQIHWPDATTPISETMEALEILLQQGKIRAAGVSNYSVEQVAEARQSLNIASNQIGYSMLNRGVENDLVPYALENDLGIIVYSPMERGLLTGKYFKDGKLKDNDHRNGYFQQFDLEKVKTFLKTITPIAEDKNATLSQLVLRWTSLQPAITVVLAGARNAEQAAANAKAMDINLTAEELAFINTELSKI